MALGKTVRLAIGVGCRRGCPAETIVTLVGHACDGLAAASSRLFTIDTKLGDAGLAEAAARLGLSLTFLSADCLRDAIPGVATRSPVVEKHMGVASVAEAAALAGAGQGAMLIVPRRSSGGATCAIAVASEVR